MKMPTFEMLKDSPDVIRKLFQFYTSRKSTEQLAQIMDLLRRDQELRYQILDRYLSCDQDLIRTVKRYVDKLLPTMSEKDSENGELISRLLDFYIGLDDKEHVDQLTRMLMKSDDKTEELVRLLDNICDVDWNSVEKILKNGCKYDPTVNDNLLKTACLHSSRPDIVRLILSDKRVDPSANNNHIFRMVCCDLDEELEIAKILLADPRVDPSDMYNEPIKDACASGHTEIVKLLLADKRVDPTVSNSLPLTLAVESCHTEIVKLLLDDKRCDPETVFELACAKGCDEIVELLLEDGQFDPSGNEEVCSVAISSDDPEVVRVLLDDERVVAFPQCNPISNIQDIIRLYAKSTDEESEAVYTDILLLFLDHKDFQRNWLIDVIIFGYNEHPDTIEEIIRYAPERFNYLLEYYDESAIDKAIQIILESDVPSLEARADYYCKTRDWKKLWGIVDKLVNEES